MSYLREKMDGMDGSPEFTTEVGNGELVVLVSRRAGATDDDIAREARRRAGALLPVRFDRPDDPANRYPGRTEIFRTTHSLKSGIRLVFASDIDRVFWFDDLRESSEDEAMAWAWGHDDRMAWVTEGGRPHVASIHDDQGKAEWTIVGDYFRHHRGVWVVPGDDHWPRCNECREPWPCQTHHKASTRAFTESRERACCYRCGKADGHRYEFRQVDGFPERRMYHTRKGACLNAAVKWAAEHGWELMEFRGGGRTFRRASERASSQ